MKTLYVTAAAFGLLISSAAFAATTRTETATSTPTTIQVAPQGEYVIVDEQPTATTSPPVTTGTLPTHIPPAENPSFNGQPCPQCQSEADAVRCPTGETDEAGEPYFLVTGRREADQLGLTCEPVEHPQ